MKTPATAKAAALALGGALAACNFAPAYQTPETAAPAAAYRESADWKPAQPADAQPRGPWWSLYADPQLDALQARVTDANQDLKAAFARLQQARAEVRVARADLFPTVTAGPSLTRSRTSINGPRYVPGTPTIGNDFNLSADLSYEVDVWGRVRNAVSSARAGAEASAADLATLDLATHAELAGDYFLLRSADTRQILLDQTVADYSRALQLEQKFFHRE